MLTRHEFEIPPLPFSLLLIFLLSPPHPPKTPLLTRNLLSLKLLFSLSPPLPLPARLRIFGKGAVANLVYRDPAPREGGADSCFFVGSHREIGERGEEK